MKKFIYAVLAFSPALAFAQGNLNGILTLVGQLGQIIAKIIPIMFALAIIYFFWGLITYIRSAGDPKKASEGKSIMIYGVIAITVMVALYGIINWITVLLNVQTGGTISLPTVPGLGQ